jgi:hypothetical protein
MLPDLRLPRCRLMESSCVRFRNLDIRETWQPVSENHFLTNMFRLRSRHRDGHTERRRTAEALWYQMSCQMRRGIPLLIG